MSDFAKDINVPNNDCISRQAAIDVAMRYCPDDDGTCSKAGTDLRELLDELEDLPSAEPQERKTGRWVYGEDDSGQDGWTCSECGFFIPWYYDYYGLNNIDFIRVFHTCPHCDAKMLTYTGKEDGGGA